jgi:very-short-patch-repair endonuclease
MPEFRLRKWGEKRGADFYCHKAGLVVELDGSVHDEKKEEDAKRDEALNKIELRIVRFRNDEVVRDLSVVVGRIRELISK